MRNVTIPETDKKNHRTHSNGNKHEGRERCYKTFIPKESGKRHEKMCTLDSCSTLNIKMRECCI